MMWRLNFLVLFCCIVLRNDYMLYYICPMHTLFTVRAMPACVMQYCCVVKHVVQMLTWCVASAWTCRSTMHWLCRLVSTPLWALQTA